MSTQSIESLAVAAQRLRLPWQRGAAAATGSFCNLLSWHIYEWGFAWAKFPGHGHKSYTVLGSGKARRANVRDQDYE